MSGALPNALVGLRWAIGSGWLALVFSETVNAQSGIGYLITLARDAYRTDVILVGLVVYSFLGLAADLIVRCWNDGSSPGGRVQRHMTDVVPPSAVQGPERLTRSSSSDADGHAAAAVVRGLRKRFGDRVVIDGMNLRVARGEFVVLLGRSGCGKRTLLRVLAGLDPEIDGEMLVAPRRAIAFQTPLLMPWKAVWRNVVLGLAKADRAVAEHALAEVGLAHLADAWPRTLSGGEAQRVALARAMVREPELLLLDEPFGPLDALTRLTAQRLVANLWTRHRPAVLLVTHDVEEALRLGDRVLVMADGAIRHELRVETPRPRTIGNPELLSARGRLPAALGVEEP